VPGRIIPAFVNPDSGSAKASLAALEKHPDYDVRLTPAAGLIVGLREAVRAGAPRVVVAGGDGTLATAASVLTGSATALAVLPAGTLNHFARDHGIPTDPGQALDLAGGGRVTPVDVGYVNDQLFLNTSSVGAYVRFVEFRDALERHLGYWPASVVAGLRILYRLRNIRVTLELDREPRVYQVRLVSIAVGERSLTPPGLGRLKGPPGRVLHVVVSKGRRQARRLARAYAMEDRGLPVKWKPPGLDSVLVQRVRLDLARTEVKVATDGEIRRMRTPLEYRLERDALRLVVPAE